MEKGHKAFADTTAGGEHIPGGAGVLAVDYTNDCTAGIVSDGTFKGRGVVWGYSDTSNFGVLFCNTSASEATTAGDWTVLKMHPDLQWSGGDVTWAGDHAFAGSVCIAGGLYADASVDISGTANIDDITTKTTVKVGTDLAVFGDMSVDGTADFADGVAFAAEVSVDGAAVFGGNVDVTSTRFSVTATDVSIGPQYSGGESITLPNGLIMKMGSLARGATWTDISFATPFPNNILSAYGQTQLAGTGSATDDRSNHLLDVSKNGFSSRGTIGATCFWTAIGY
jgi:hypothetical protein